ncbi:MAG: hypothetical protein AB1Z98_07965, partial [Nannocystaceae bacterium]
PPKATEPHEGGATANEASKPAVSAEVLDDSSTARWPSVDAPILEDDETPRPRPRTGLGSAIPPEIEASASSSGLRAPALSSEASGISPADSAAAWPNADDWQLPELDSPGDAAASLTAPRLPRPSALAGPKAPPGPPKPAATPSPTEEGTDGSVSPEPTTASSEAARDLPTPVPGVPRLPVPGMLRDGLEPRAADFRAKTRNRPATAAAMSPFKGVAPPKLTKEGEPEPPRIKPGDTATFVAEVAVELIAEAKAVQQEAAAAAEGSTAAGVVPLVSTSPVSTPPEGPVVVGPSPSASASPSSSEGDRRPLLLALLGGTAAALVGLVLWMAMRGDGEPPPQAAAAAVQSAQPDEPETQAALAPDLPAATGSGDGTTGSASTGLGSDSGSSDDGSSPSSDSESSTGAAAGSGDGTTGEPLALEDEEPVTVASSSRPSSRPSGKPRPKDPPPVPTNTPAPTPKPTPKAPPPEPSAAELLEQANAAYRKGQGSKAYQLALRSHKKRPTAAAAELVTVAACQMNDVDKARNALKKVALMQRGKVRGTCKSKHGVRIPL